MLTTGESSSTERIRDIKTYLDSTNHWFLPFILTAVYATLGRLLIHIYLVIPRWLEVRKNAADKLAHDIYEQLSKHRARLESVLVHANQSLGEAESYSIRAREHLAKAQNEDAKATLDFMTKKIRADRKPLSEYQNLTSGNLVDSLRELREGDLLMTFLGIKNPKPDFSEVTKK